MSFGLIALLPQDIGSFLQYPQSMILSVYPEHSVYIRLRVFGGPGADCLKMDKVHCLLDVSLALAGVKEDGVTYNDVNIFSRTGKV